MCRVQKSILNSAESQREVVFKRCLYLYTKFESLIHFEASRNRIKCYLSQSSPSVQCV